MSSQPIPQPGEVPGQLPLFDAPPRTMDLRGKHAELLAANRAKFTELTRMGAMPDPVGVVLTRLNTLLDVLLDPTARVQFDVLFEDAMSQMLDACLAEARKRALTTGLGPTPGSAAKLIVPG